MDEEIFGVSGWKNQANSSILERGRYPFKILDIRHHTSDAGNKCVIVDFRIEEIEISHYFILEDSTGKKHRMAFMWANFLYAIGIRDKRQDFDIPKSRILAGEGLADVIVKPKPLDDGTSIPENKIRDFAPIEQETAPLKDVPPESESIPKLESEPEKKPEEPEEVEIPKEEEEEDI